jgi:hypothetical protein
MCEYTVINKTIGMMFNETDLNKNLKESIFDKYLSTAWTKETKQQKFVWETFFVYSIARARFIICVFLNPTTNSIISPIQHKSRNKSESFVAIRGCVNDRRIKFLSEQDAPRSLPSNFRHSLQINNTLYAPVLFIIYSSTDTRPHIPTLNRFTFSGVSEFSGGHFFPRITLVNRRVPPEVIGDYHYRSVFGKR